MQRKVTTNCCTVYINRSSHFGGIGMRITPAFILKTRLFSFLLFGYSQSDQTIFTSSEKFLSSSVLSAAKMYLELLSLGVAVWVSFAGYVDPVEAHQYWAEVCKFQDCPTSSDAGILNITRRFLPRYHQPLIKHNQVLVFAELSSIIHVDEKQETVTTSLMMYEAYAVTGITWETWFAAVEDKYLFFVPPDLVWKPDIVIFNGVGAVVRSYEKASITAVGGLQGELLLLVTFASPMTLTTRCTFNVEQFPFDAQTCNIDITNFLTSINDFGGWGFTLVHPRDSTVFTNTTEIVKKEVDPDAGAVEREELAMTLTGYQENSQWILEGVPFHYFTRRSAIDDQVNSYSSIRYTLKIERRPKFFLLTLIIPCSLLSMLTVLSVFLPVDSGEKISLGITIMLAQVVNLLILSGLLPESSLSFPALGIYFLMTIGIIALTVVYNTVIISIYYDGDASVTSQFRKFFCRKKTSPLEKSAGPADREDVTGSGRKALCKLLDRIFGVLFLILILTLHIYYFGEKCFHLVFRSG